MDLLKRTWADISLDALAHNYETLRARLPSGCRFLGVVKADAYGHGAVPISAALSELGAEYLAVSNLEEAVQLRRGGIRLPVLILGCTPPDHADELAELGITQEIHSLEYARQLESRLQGSGRTVNVHLKLDTGMTRIGFFAYGEALRYEDLLQAARLPHLHTEGVFMHFSAADSLAPEDRDYTRLQYARFSELLSRLKADGVEPEIRHCCNSGAAILYPEYALDMVRPGIALYGLAPSADTQGLLPLQPLMSVHSCVAEVRTVPAGACIGYGRTYTAPQALRVAVLPMGYADGLSRALSGQGSFRIRGKDAPILGRICMDMCMADVSDIPGVQVGDTATLFGTAEDGTLLPVERLSDSLGTISYELLCAVNKRVPRIYRQGGRTVEVLQCIV